MGKLDSMDLYQRPAEAEKNPDKKLDYAMISMDTFIMRNVLLEYQNALKDNNTDKCAELIEGGRRTIGSEIDDLRIKDMFGRSEEYSENDEKKFVEEIYTKSTECHRKLEKTRAYLWSKEQGKEIDSEVIKNSMENFLLAVNDLYDSIERIIPESIRLEYIDKMLEEKNGIENKNERISAQIDNLIEAKSRL